MVLGGLLLTVQRSAQVHFKYCRIYISALLAAWLSNRMQGVRPVTLVGVSLGATLVFSCLEKLHAQVKIAISIGHKF